MNITYCNEKCEIGKEKCEKLLNKNNSAFDAAVDFALFIEKCYKTCPHKNEHYTLTSK